MIDFSLTEEQEMMKVSIQGFFKKECSKEYIREKDEKEEFPYELYQKFAGEGWLGLAYPEKYGGSDGTVLDVAVALEEVARGMYSMAFPVASNWVFAGDAILHFGTEEQKSYYLTRMAKGEILFAFAMTEPNAGSDALSLTTSAIPDGNDYILNGNKIFSSFAHVAQKILVVARTDKSAPSQKALTTFIVDPKLAGVTIRKLKTLGRRAEGLAEIFFEDVRVPRENIVGGLHQAWANMTKTLQRERAIAGAPYTGGAQAVIDEIVQYAKERVQFGRPIGKFQAIAHMIADMQTEVDCARLLTYYACWRVSRGLPAARESSQAKLKAGETYVKVANEAMQIMGGYGFMMEYDMQRHWRDSRPSTYAGGSSQIQRTIIAKELGL